MLSGQGGLLQIEALVESQLVIGIGSDATVCVIVEVDVSSILGAFPDDGLGIDQVSSSASDTNGLFRDLGEGF